MDVAADEDGVAKVVYVEDADVSGSTDVIYALADTDPKIVRNSDISDYYEIDAVVNGEVVTLNVKTNSTAAEKLVTDIAANGADMYEVTEDEQWIVALEGITENSDGLVTNVRVYDPESDGDGFVSGTGTGKAENETVRLDDESSRFAWDDEVVVVRYDYKGDFSVSRISSIKTDANDGYVAVLDSNVLTGICIIEKNGGEGEDSETITEGDVSYTASVSSRGNGTIVFDVDRPEYVPADSTVRITGDLYVNGVDDNTQIDKTVAADSSTVRWNGSDFDPDDELTVENLEVSYQKVTVRYLDGDNNNRELADSTFTSFDDELTVATADDVKFTLDTNTTTAPDLEYTVTGLASGNVTTRTDLPADNNAEQTVVSSRQAAGNNYVTVTIYGLDGLADNETYTISNGTNVSGGQMSQLVNGTGATLKNLDANLAGNDDKLLITTAKSSGITSDEKVGVTISMPTLSETDVAGYTVSVKMGDSTITGEFDSTSDVVRVEVPVTGNIVVNASDITITPTYKLTETHALSSDGRTLTVTFNQAIDPTTATKNTISFTDSSNGSATVDTVTVSGDGKTLTITAMASFDAFATGDKFTLSNIEAADDTFGSQKLTSGEITLS